MKTITINLKSDEKSLVNRILMENCMNLTDLVRIQKTKEGAEQAMQIIQTAVVAQHAFFDASIGEEFEISKAIAEFIKPILETNSEKLNEVKEKLIKAGDPQGFMVSSTAEILSNIVNKFPNPSLIITP